MPGATATSVRARALAWGKPRRARAADLSAAAAEEEDGHQDDTAGDAQVGCPASKNNETELRKLRDEIQSLKDENQSLKDEIQTLKDQLHNVGTPSATATSRDGKVDAEPAAEWGVAGWVNSLDLTEVVAKALKEPPGTADPFKYVLSLTFADLKDKLEAVKLSEAIAETLWYAIEKLHGQSAATGAALNAKFAAEGDAFKGEMGFGGVEQFYGGLEKLIGPPLMVDGSLFKAMETEHCAEKDADVPFDTSNGIEGATSRMEWEFVVAPVVEDGRYAERGGDFRTAHPEWCRKPEPLSVYQKKMADAVNPRLEAAGQAPLTKEELVAGRLYTGPMYEKYNGVLRFSSARGADGAVRMEYASIEEVPFLQKKCGWLHLGEWAATAAGKGEPSGAVRWTWNNKYTTTIHAINSIIVKLSPLTKITPLYRGWTGATLPEDFFKPDALGFRGGVEYGFSSTTTDRAQAVHYADGKASTVLELVMGMIDRGADISWLSQYPHERETLLPPLMGLQVRSTGVEGSTLVVRSSFSINMASLTLEQVAGKRKKLLTDMGAQMAAEVRRGVAGEAAEEASQLVRAHLGLERYAGVGGAADKRLEAPLGDEAEAYNNDQRFQAAVGDALKVKRLVTLAAMMQRGGGGGLAAAMDTVLPLQASGVDLTGYDLGDDGVMVGTVVAWMESEPSALTSLTLDWGKACGCVREALLGVVRTTRTLFVLSVEKTAKKLNPLQLNGREAVTSLDLSREGLGDGSVAVVAAGLSVNAVLTNLVLMNNNIGDEGAAALASALRVNEVLTELRLGVNGIGDEGAKALASALRVNEMLTNLDLTDCGIGVEGAKAIGSALAVNGVLNALDLRENEIGDKGAMALASAIRVNEVLKDLNLRNNGIGDEGAKALASALRVNGVLTTLNISYNQIHDEGAVAIAEALRGNGVLTDLNLSGNNIGGGTGWIKASEVEGESKEVGSKVIYQGREMVVSVGVDSDGELKLVDVVQTGVLAIAKALEVNEVLTSLDVGLNQIGPTGATAFAEALRVNEVLKKLDMRSNSIGDEGAMAIGGALAVNEVLTKLNLDGHALDLPKLRGTDPVESLNLSSKDLGPASAIVIASLIAGNGVLKALDIGGNDLGDEGARAIRDAVSGREGFELEIEEGEESEEESDEEGEEGEESEEEV